MTVRTYALEMMLATLMVTCGVALLWPGQTFLLPQYSVMRTWIPEDVGAGLLILVGVARWAAILRNGGSRYTPLWRIGACCIGCGFWFTLAVALTKAFADMPPSELGPPLLLAVAVTTTVFEVYAARRGGADASAHDSLHLRQSRSKAGAHVS